MHVYTTFCLFNHLSIDTWVAFIFWLLWIMLLWTWAYKYLFEILLSVLFGRYPSVQWLDYMVLLCVVFWETAVPISIKATPFFIPNSNSQGCQFLHILANTCYILFFLIVANPMGVKWYLIMALICISLMISDADHLFMCLKDIQKPFVYVLWRNGYSSPLPIFKFHCLFFVVAEL